MRAHNYQSVDKKNSTELAVYAFISQSNFALTLGYLNLALKNSAQIGEHEDRLRLDQVEVVKDARGYCQERIALPTMNCYKRI